MPTVHISYTKRTMLEITVNDIASLMQRHRQELMRYLSQRIGCNETAQDIFQETFLRYAGYDGKSSVENPRAFIFRIATNLATDYLRSRSRHYHEDIDAEEGQTISEIEDPRLSVERTAISQQQLEQLISALAELPPKCSEVFIMLKIKHYSYAEVEQKLGISNTMIFNYLTRAMAHCRQRLGDLD